MTTYKKGATITDRPNILHDGKLHINCKDKRLLKATGWEAVEIPEPKWWWELIGVILRMEL